MELKYELTNKDFTAFYKYCSKYTRLKDQFNKRFILFFFLYILAVLFAAIFIEDVDINLPSLILTFFIVVIPIIGIMYLYSTSLAPTPKGWMLGMQTMSITDIGLQIESDLYKITVQWKAIKDIIQTPAYIFLFVDTIAGYIIPKHIFTNTEEMNTFFEKLIQYKKSA